MQIYAKLSVQMELALSMYVAMGNRFNQSKCSIRIHIPQSEVCLWLRGGVLWNLMNPACGSALRYKTH